MLRNFFQEHNLWLQLDWCSPVPSFSTPLWWHTVSIVAEETLWAWCKFAVNNTATSTESYSLLLFVFCSYSTIVLVCQVWCVMSPNHQNKVLMMLTAFLCSVVSRFILATFWKKCHIFWQWPSSIVKNGGFKLILIWLWFIVVDIRHSVIICCIIFSSLIFRGLWIFKSLNVHWAGCLLLLDPYFIWCNNKPYNI